MENTDLMTWTWAVPRMYRVECDGQRIEQELRGCMAIGDYELASLTHRPDGNKGLLAAIEPDMRRLRARCTEAFGPGKIVRRSFWMGMGIADWHRTESS